VPLQTTPGQAGSPPVLAFAAPLPLRLVLLAALGFALALLAGCADKQGGPIPYNAQLTAPDAPAIATLEEDYKIAPLDKVHINVFQVPDLTGDFDVDLTGNISLPLVGNVRAVDMTTKQFDDKLTQLLAEKYLQHPDVSVAVKESSTRVVTIDGSVRQPGVFPVTSRLTLVQAVALAHGADENANLHRVAVFRTIQGQRMAAAFDLERIRRGQDEDPRVYSGDIVVVDGSKTKAAWKNILQGIPILTLFRPF
jgi:polysaccharide export outer membrane protein